MSAAETNERERSCEERIADHLRSRFEHVRDLVEVADLFDNEEESEAAWRLYDAGELDSPKTCTADELSEAARERMYELPLGVSSQTVFRIELSTGGPGDWLEVQCSGDTPNYEPAGDGAHYEVERITYHFNDWFDHAERQLSADSPEFQAFERFAQSVVPELGE